MTEQNNASLKDHVWEDTNCVKTGVDYISGLLGTE
jgi:hypothetical protein